MAVDLNQSHKVAQMLNNTLFKFLEKLFDFINRRQDKEYILMKYQAELQFAKQLKETGRFSTITITNPSVYKYMIGRIKEEAALGNKAAAVLAQKGPDGKYYLQYADNELTKHFVQNIKREALIREGNRLQHVGMLEFVNVCKKTGEKNILYKDNLTSLEKDSLVNKINNGKSGYTVSVMEDSKNKGKYMVAVNEKYAFPKTTHTKDFAQCLLESKFSLYGVNDNIKERQIEYDKNVLKTIEEAQKTSTELYVLTGNPRKANEMISISKDGFQVIKYDEKDGRSITVESHSDRESNYDDLLRQKLDSTKDIILTDDTLKAYSHIQNVERMKCTRPRLSKVDFEKRQEEKVVVNEIDKAIKASLAKEHKIDIKHLDNGTITYSKKNFFDNQQYLNEYNKKASEIIKCSLSEEYRKHSELAKTLEGQEAIDRFVAFIDANNIQAEKYLAIANSYEKDIEKGSVKVQAIDKFEELNKETLKKQLTGEKDLDRLDSDEIRKIDDVVRSNIHKIEKGEKVIDEQFVKDNPIPIKGYEDLYKKEVERNMEKTKEKDLNREIYAKSLEKDANYKRYDERENPYNNPYDKTNEHDRYNDKSKEVITTNTREVTNTEFWERHSDGTEHFDRTEQSFDSINTETEERDYD